MGTGMYFPLSAIFFLAVIIINYFQKERVNTFETKIYGKLLITNLFGLFLELLCTYASIISETDPFISDIILKLYLIYNVVWTLLLSSYVYSISNTKEIIEKKKKKLFSMLNIIFPIAVTLILVLKCDLIIENDFQTRYTTGPSVFLTYGLCAIMIFFMIIEIFKEAKKGNIKNKKYIPIYSFIILIIIGMIIQLLNPALLIMTYVETLTLTIMYHTIENPDIQMINELNIARDAADKANMAKSDFLSSMSHEIRTPLNAIVGLSEDNLKYKDSLPKEIVENTEDILSASQTLLEIVGNILDINKIESDKLELVNEPYNFKDEVTSLVKLTSSRIGDKPIEYTLNMADDIPYLLIGDKGRVKEIINNLFTNAIKYTDKGKIDINIKCINQNDICYLLIMVSDTGRGIPKEKIDRLFDRFDRLDAERNTTVEGTGLGLAITKKLVEMMHGTINVQSSFGIGSMFAVNIPQKIDNLNAPVVNENIITTTTNFGFKKILIVDDNNLNIKVASKALSDFNFEIDTVTNGIDAIEKVKNIKYDLILMDIMMPHMSGEEALKELKKDETFNIPVIALTADAIIGAKERYLSEGFIDYLAKPFSKAQIEEKLKKVFKN